MTSAGAPPLPLLASAAEELRGAVVVITGAGRRGQAGEVVASAFANDGATLVLVDRDMNTASERAGDIAGKAAAHPFGCDLSDPAAVGGLAENVS